LVPQRKCAADTGLAQGYNCLAALSCKHTESAGAGVAAREIFVTGV
jgi:hypothetical protein